MAIGVERDVSFVEFLQIELSELGVGKAAGDLLEEQVDVGRGLFD